MRGETNSAPTGGGLKVIASGTLTSNRTVSFQEQVMFVLVSARYTSGSPREFGTVVFATGQVNYLASNTSTTVGRLTLYTDGLSMRLTNLDTEIDSQIRYIAIG